MHFDFRSVSGRSPLICPQKNVEREDQWRGNPDGWGLGLGY